MTDPLPRTIALGGPDGAGKSTQAERLAARLRADGHHVVVCTIWDLLDRQAPGAVPFGSKAEIDAFLGGLHAPARALFLHMAMREALDRAIAIQGDGIVLVVGYWPKYNAAERAYGGDPALLDALAAAFPPLDLGLWLDLPPEAALARKQAVSGYESAGRGRDGFVPFQTKVRAIFDDLLARDGRWARIDGAGDADAVEAAIAARVDAWLAGR
jgi:dTMP kinase